MAHAIGIDVRYPADGRQIVLRTEHDWNVDVEPVDVAQDGTTFRFTVPPRGGSLRFKPVLVDDAGPHWANGSNRLALASEGHAVVYPTFFAERSHATDVVHLTATHGDHAHDYRVFLPPGYHENLLQHYPVVYMQDGQNLFFAEDAAFGAHWRVGETLALLTSMNALGPVIIVGVYPHDRHHEYTAPGYQHYGVFLTEELKPRIDDQYRTMSGPEHTSVIGSSLGGVAAFYLGWHYPHVFGQCAAMSSTFGYRDDLFERVASDPVPSTRFYLDSGWPGDNYESVRDMRARLLSRGLVSGRDLLYFAFPLARHTEGDWAERLHLPFQFLLDPVRRASG